MIIFFELVSIVVIKINNEFMMIMKYVMDCLWVKLFFVKCKRVLVILFVEIKDLLDCKCIRMYFF